MDKFNDILKNMENEVQVNLEKIENLMKERNILKGNCEENRLAIVFGLAMFAWFLIEMLIPVFKSLEFPVHLIMPIVIVVPVIIGGCGLKVFESKKQLRKKMASFCDAKTQKEIEEELVEKEILIRKLESSNSILKQTSNLVKLEQQSLEVLSNNDKYDVIKKEDNLKNKELLEKKMMGLNLLYDNEKEKVDNMVTKQVMENNFWRVNDIFQTVIDRLFLPLMSGAWIMFCYNLPLLAINESYNVVVNKSLASLVYSFMIGYIGGYYFITKRSKEQKEVYDDLSKKYKLENYQEQDLNMVVKKVSELGKQIIDLQEKIDCDENSEVPKKDANNTIDLNMSYDNSLGLENIVSDEMKLVRKK